MLGVVSGNAPKILHRIASKLSGWGYLSWTSQGLMQNFFCLGGEIVTGVQDMLMQPLQTIACCHLPDPQTEFQDYREHFAACSYEVCV